MEQEYVYRDVRVPGTLRGIISHIGDVEHYREELHNLGNQWDLLLAVDTVEKARKKCRNLPQLAQI